jgi:hypothetical protein
MNRLLVSALCSALAFPPLPTMAAERVGNVGAANAAAFGTPPGASRRALAVGVGVEKGERIDTSGEGNAQITFNDSSTLTVGRNSSVTIDDFTYRGGGGSQGVQLAKGVMRFVGGGVSHQSGASVRTPTASIGVRGGSVLISIGGDCGTLVVHQVGNVDVSGPNGDSVTLNHAGFGVCVNENGVSEPFRVSGQTIAAIIAEMASRGKQNGGVTRSMTNTTATVELGTEPPQDVATPSGFDLLGMQWGANAVVQSQTGVDNQRTVYAPPLVAPPTTTENPDVPDCSPGSWDTRC